MQHGEKPCRGVPPLEESLNDSVESLHDVIVDTKSPTRAREFRLECVPVLGSNLLSSPNYQMEGWSPKVRKLPFQVLMIVRNPRGLLEELIFSLRELMREPTFFREY
jgi:hypothetical protein